ncbi:tRNAIle-lysidine synthetase [Nitzschia inconspicua]|uniref:tRNA(Ile)-lysidine synthetase n=1 Tax=Nitzschia inconspicua TaxID=303405 RepID=A0A9K3P886_9STRA|nr:tRNAIle-lysidine synthetase [Nitzschia inconspicua]KAG7349908.1 tRNAIle-lysidine synthetase [Nitzschia inconspicua]
MSPTTPAASPYAPSSRNSFLRLSSSSSSIHSGSILGGNSNKQQQQQQQHRTTALMALFLVILQFWKDHRQVLWEKVVRRPSQRLVDFLRTLSFPSNLLLHLHNNHNNNSNSNPSTAAVLCQTNYPNHNKNNNHNNDDNKQENTLSRVQENLRLIRSVLDYWFGQYSPDGSQKMLWMVAASSSLERQQTVDAEITNQFEQLLVELSSSSSSSSSSPSSSCCMSQQQQQQRFNDWVVDPDHLYGSRGKIAAIIVLDQFSRHILRYYQQQQQQLQQRTDHPFPFPISQSTFDQRALQASERLIQEHIQEINCGMIPLPMYIFALMPYRHASTIETVQYVQDCIEQAANRNVQMDAMLSRFRKATNRRMAVLQDEARRTGRAFSQHITNSNRHHNHHHHHAVSTTNTTNNNDNAGVTVEQFTDDDILETFPFHADRTTAIHHPVHKTMVQFLTEQGIHPSNSVPAAVIVSLSGGVDSMVIASVLAHLKQSCGYDQLHIIAVHIDYANRPESGAEADFVRRYCTAEYLNIDFYCRRIGEVTRGITARDDYERIARTIRYDSYREAVAKARAVLPNNNDRGAVVGVMLGHHRGDLRENVLSNAHKGCGPLDLSGMTAVSVNDGIVVYRPLLPLEKTSVLDYAHKFGVPYFKDTTPHWSTRGKLRNKLLPLLEEIYGDGCMNNLSNLAVESDECRSLLQKSIIGPFMDAIVRKPMGIIMDTTPWKDQPVFFWKFVLREALHSAKLGMFSDKSVQEFLKRVQAPKLKNAWLQCRRDYGVYLQEDGKVFVFYPTSFPWNNKKDPYGVEGRVIDCKCDKDWMVGPWNVRVETLDGSSFQDAAEEPTDWLAKRAVSSMENFMNGKIEYYLEVRAVSDTSHSPSLLVFGQFNKSNRPEAWKNSDLKIQSTLPLLCIDNANEDTNNQDTDGSPTTTTTLIRVSLELKV